MLSATAYTYALQLINNIITSFSYSYNTIGKYYNSVYDIFTGTNNVWCFISGSPVPIIKSTIRNYNDLNIEWEYNTVNNILYNITQSDENVQAKLKILSADIVINNKTYNLDNFIENLRIKTCSSRVPTLQLIFNTWCASTSIWYSTTDTISFNIIDNNGDSHKLDLNRHNRCLYMGRNGNIEFRVE